MPRIAWIEDADATGRLAELYNIARSRAHSRGRVPDVVRTLSLRPDFLEAIMNAVNRLHFTDGALTRAQHEMIATYVAALNRCHF